MEINKKEAVQKVTIQNIQKNIISKMQLFASYATLREIF